MKKLSKRFKEIVKLYEPGKSYLLADAIEILKKCPPVKFDQSVTISLLTGVDTKQADQQVRGTVTLPHGTGKKIVVIVFAKGEKIKEALGAGADFAGEEDLLAKVRDGWTDFDLAISTPDMMREVGKLGKVLGPRGLMPSPKAGTVTADVKKAVEEFKKGKVEFKVDKTSVINNFVAKLSFDKQMILENAETLIAAISRAKPASAKQYLKSLYLSSTMGPGLKIDLNSIHH